MRDGRTRRRFRLTPTLVLLGLALVLTACGAPQSALEPHGPFAKVPDDLFRLVFWIAVVVFILVQTLIVVAIVRSHRAAKDPSLPVQVHGNTRLEIFWTVIPALILAGIAVPTVRSVFQLDKKPDNAITIDVVGHRWWWEISYPENGGFKTANEFAIPTNRPVRLRMTSEEAGGPANAVIHSFWVPKLAGKQDVVPGRITTLNIQADDPGRYLGQCAEYCGLSHANMRVRVDAMPPDQFDQWVANMQQGAAKPEPGSKAAEGEKLVVGGTCAACHTVRGAEVAVADGSTAKALGNVGPDLTHLMTRREFAGATFDLYRQGPDGTFTDEPDVENLKKWLRDPVAMKPMRPAYGVGMPNLGLSEDEIDKIVAYLITLK